MTEIRLDSDRSQRIIKLTTLSVGYMLMMLGLYFSTSMLGWAVNHRISKVEKVEVSEVTTKVRERQLVCLAKNIYHEAGGEPFEGKVAIAQVTINRANSGDFPGDICKVVYQKNVFYEKVLCQFSWYCQKPSNKTPKNVEAYKESEKVARQVLLEGFRLPGLTDALYFHAKHVKPNWPHQKVAVIGGHIFYKPKD